MGILYETAEVTRHNTEENKFSFNRSLEVRERNDPDREIAGEFQEQRREMPMKQVSESPISVRDYAAIGSEVKKVLEKADQLDTEKKIPAFSDYMQSAGQDANERAVQQLTVHKTEAYGYFDELGKKLGKIAKNTETMEDDRYAGALRKELGAQLANINSVSVGDVENTFYELSK